MLGNYLVLLERAARKKVEGMISITEEENGPSYILFCLGSNDRKL